MSNRNQPPLPPVNVIQFTTSTSQHHHQNQQPNNYDTRRNHQHQPRQQLTSGGGGTGRAAGIPVTTLHTATTTANNTDCGSSSGSDSDDIVHQFREYERTTMDTDNATQRLILALANRCYHLPTNTNYCDDWMQYFQNNHPILSICCHHKLHPIGIPIRLLHLTGSIVLGLAITNIVWLYFYYHGSNSTAPAITINVRGFQNNGVVEDPNTNGDILNTTNSSTWRIDQISPSNDDTNETNNEFTVTQGMIVLWTFGAMTHALFDNTVWYMTTCICCLSSQQLQRYRKWGTYAIVVTVLIITTLATSALILRTSAEHMKHQEDNPRTTTTHLSFHETSISKIVICYVIEFAIALFIYYPMIATILFSGILGCGNIPILGGRPYEIKQLEKERQKGRSGSSSSRNRQQNQQRSSTTTSNNKNDVLRSDISKLKAIYQDIEQPRARS